MLEIVQMCILHNFQVAVLSVFTLSLSYFWAQQVKLMNNELLEALKKISEEELAILDGNNTIQKELYTSNNEFIIDSSRMLEKGKLIDIRPHTRFVHFPKHRHNYIEIVYMCTGSTTHIINTTTTVMLEEGELLFLSPNATQEILPAGKDDVAVNFVVVPEFFDHAFMMMEESNVLHDFLVSCLRGEVGSVDYLHFRVKDVLPVQNLVENMLYSLAYKVPGYRNINQTTMGLLMALLQKETDKLLIANTANHEQNLMFKILRYVEDSYKTATLEELSRVTGQPDYAISKLIKKNTGYTFKALVQAKRLNQAAFLLTTTMLPVEKIIAIVGYDNTSYFHKIFRESFRMTPRVYRLTVGSENALPAENKTGE